MNDERAKAIGNEQEKTAQGGQGRFNYVDTKKLERLGITLYKIRQGDNFIRIISPPDLTKFYGREIFIHTKIGADGITVLCLDKMYGEPCPVCEYRKELQSKGVDSAVLSALSYSRRYLFFVYDVKDESSEEEGLRWFDSPCVVKDNIVTLSKDKRTGNSIDVSDPEKGRDVEFSRTGTGIKHTKYRGFKLDDNNPIPDDWCKDVPEFDDILLKPNYDKVQEVVMGSTEKVEEEEKPEVVDVSTLTGRRSRRSRSESSESTVAKSEEGKPVEEEKEVVDESESSGRRSRRSRTESSESTAAKSEDEKSVKEKLAEIREQHKED